MKTESGMGEHIASAAGKGRIVSVVLPVLLFVAAVAIRIPYFTEIPRFRGNELGVTLELVKGERFPLYNQHPHIGALSNYLHAGGFWILGLHYWVPSLLSVLAGSATVVLVYFLGLRTSGIAIAVLASLLMTCSVFHVYFISHVPWSNCLTPLFVVLFALCLAKALQQKSVAWLVFSGFVYGMAQQTHPSVVTIVPAALFLFFSQGKERLRWWLGNRLTYLLLPAVVLGGANLLWYNLTSQWHSVRYELTYPQYALESDPGVRSFSQNSFEGWTLILRLLSGSVETKLIEFFWKEPLFLLCLVLLAAGLLITLLSRNRVLPAFFLSSILLIPVVNRSYELCTLGRYLGFLIPFGILLCATAVVWGCRGVARLGGRWSGILMAVLVSGLLLYAHISALSRVYAVLQSRDHSYVFLSTLKMLKPYDRKNTAILVDPQAHDFPMLITFLRSDGWEAEAMRAEGSSRKVKNFRYGNFDPLASQVSELESRNPELKIIAILSPLNLRQFLEQAPVQTLEACLRYDEKKHRRNLYYALLGKVYFVFGLSSQTAAVQNSPLEALMRLRPYIPDDLHTAITRRGGSRKIEKVRVPERIRKTFDSQMEHISVEVPIFPETNSSICMEEKELLRRLARGETIR